MITLVKYEFLKVIRNTRFILFTLLFPLGFYVGLYFGSSNDYYASDNKSFMLFILCSIFSVVGSGLMTLSTRISKERNYFKKVIRVTPLSSFKYVFISGLVQLILNIMLVLILTVIGVLICDLKVDILLFKTIGIIIIFSLFFIFLGIILGFVLDIVSLQTVSFPIYAIAILSNITNKILPYIPDTIANIQKFFPGYYATDSIIGIITNQSICLSFFALCLFVVGISILSVLVVKIASKR